MGVEGFAQSLLRPAVLPHRFGDIIADALAEDVRRRLVFGDVAAPLADNGDEFGLAIDEGAVARDVSPPVLPARKRDQAAFFTGWVFARS